jgi:Xaa-Pro aminopeptidase
MLTPESLPALQRALADEELDGWLVFDFHGVNPVAGGLLGLEGLLTRRVFAYIPSEGLPVAITHAIEQGPWHRWPKKWHREIYSSWQQLEGLIAGLVRGKRVAMEYSPGDAVPYLDRVPAGVVELVRGAGAEVVSSAPLVTSFYAAWSKDHLASHRRSAEKIAKVAREAMVFAGERAAAGTPVAEHELQKWITDAFTLGGLVTNDPPIVAAGANAADPHYSPSASRPRPIKRGELLLIDLWAREPGNIYADQTWMASLGEPSPRAVEVWESVRDARDAAIAILRERIGHGEAIRGGEVDDVTRGVIRDRGFGQYFTHRTGHSIDPRELHGSGPHIDNMETREERVLAPGVGFSLEPGIYIAGEIGMRTEVNAYVGEREVIITPAEIQRDLLVV